MLLSTVMVSALASISSTVAIHNDHVSSPIVLSHVKDERSPAFPHTNENKDNIQNLRAQRNLEGDTLEQKIRSFEISSNTFENANNGDKNEQEQRFASEFFKDMNDEEVMFVAGLAFFILVCLSCCCCIDTTFLRNIVALWCCWELCCDD